MTKIPRRDKFKIYGDLLSSIQCHSSDEKIVLTQLQIEINVPFDRLKKYISDIKNLGLIQNENSLKLTKKGIQYVRMYKQVLDFMKRMGLAYR